MKHLSLSLVAVALLPLSAQAQPQASKAPLPCPLVRVSDTGRTGSTTLAMSTAYTLFSRMHSRGSAFRLADLPLPGGVMVDLDLRPVSALAKGARAQAVQENGSVRMLHSNVRCFSGRVVDGGHVFIGLTPGDVNGYLDYRGERYFLSSGGRPGSGSVVVAHSDSLGDMGFGECGVDSFMEPEIRTYGPSSERLIVPLLRTADVFIEADNQLRARFASDQECFDYVVLLVTATSEIYRRDLGARLNIPDKYLRIWNTVPPWGPINGFSALSNVYTYWQSGANPLRDLPRAAVHVLTNPVFGGTARGTGGLCSNVRAYEISSLRGRFPYPREHTSRENWDLFVLSHEFGHTFGSIHSETYSPPIECADGSGPDRGTIMSYCHIDNGIANVGMRFHVREQQRIEQLISRWKCLREQPLSLGDYDGDEAHTQADLVALSSLLAQGFRSLASELVMDMDGDGRLTEADHALLSELVYVVPSASVSVRNGKGINPVCLEASGTPVLGRRWRTRVFTGASGVQTLVVGYDQPHVGLRTARGELLVRTAPLGGAKLYSSPVVSSGKYAIHDFDFPLDAALFGRKISFQGLVLNGTDDHYCNALDVVLSPN